ncbi:MAG: hypothetical protein Q7R80_04045 [bacterium]|nr:hypothetical protein [bacterium]
MESPTQHGTNAVQMNVAATGVAVELTQRITVTLRGSYALSAAVRIPSPGAGGVSGTPSLELKQTVGAVTTTVCTASVVSPPLDTWVQPSTTCALDPGTYSVVIRVAATGASAVFVDSVQVELGTSVTAFHEGYRPDAPRTYLRAAPNDIRCYDLNGDGTLNTANDPVDGSCSQFALGCTEAEVGCERYTPADGTPSVNGQVNDIDRCPRECVGYAAFREVNSNFDQRSDFDYFIPSTARQCTVEEVGCSEFTNLDALERGGEQREFFSFLRRCEKPGTTGISSATYYTWEGSDQQGFQLRSFVLKRSGGENSAPDVFGTDPWSPTTPPTFTDSKDCRYSADPIVLADCRAFYSQNGTIAHRQLSRTTLITDDCVRYRPSHLIPPTTCTELGGAVTGGACVVKGHRQESRQCNAAAMNCRAYRGNASGVVQTILDSSFETVDGVGAVWREGWDVGTQSSEALTVGQHSLSMAGAGAATLHSLTTTLTGLTAAQCAERSGTFIAAGGAVAVDTCVAPTVTRGHTYEIIIVGKGSGRLAVTMPQAGTTLTNLASYSVTLGPTWQLLRAGPLIVEQQPSSAAQLRLTVATGGAAFLDQIILREVPQLTTVIKGSWQTPQQCDRASIAQDAPPQALGMLGCRAYQPRSGPTATLRSFSRLCSETVVGCTVFHDTKNSANVNAEPFNASDLPVSDDVIVPADSLRYLVNDPTKSCAATAKGCARFGKPTMDRSGTDAVGQVSGWGDAYLVDDPGRYTGAGATLCQDAQLFCDEYRGRDGALIYFKDPVNRKCQYKEEVTPITLRALTSATCTTRGGTFVADSPGGTIGTCTISGIPTTGWFQGDTSIPCYEDLIIEGARYGIRPNADAAYRGWAGLCEAEQDQCSELRDPTDVSREYPTGHLYSVLHDGQLDLASCGGNVSRKSGCAILDESLNPSKLWSAAVTYVESDRQSGALVAPVDCDRNPTACRRCVVERACRNTSGVEQDGVAGGAIQIVSCTTDANCDFQLGFRCTGGEIGATCATVSTAGAVQDNVCDGLVQDHSVCRQLSNDTNLIAKVKRDRACSQWLEKDGCYDAWVPEEGRVVQACTGLRRTGSADAPGAPGSGIITLASYRSRPQTWSSADASGLSIPNQPPIGKLEQISTDDDYKLSLVHCPTSAPASQNCGDINGLCADDTAEFDVCGPPLPEFGNAQGICVHGRCAYGLEPPAAGATGATRVTSWPSPSCKVFPESDSPFPNVETVIKRGGIAGPNDDVPQPGFNRANICEDGECRCSYQKIQYGDGITKYFTAENTTTPAGYCVGGEFDGLVCNPSVSTLRTLASQTGRSCNRYGGTTLGTNPDYASRNGRCVARKRIQVFHGIEGYCLEEDRSMVKNGDQTQYACLSFLPIDQLQGSFDTNSQFQSAGLTLLEDQDWYCAGKREGAGRAPLSLRMVRVAALPTTPLIVMDGTVGGTYASSAPQLFGPPQNPPPGYQSSVNERGTMPEAPIGPRDADWHDNCEDTNREAWCGLPSKDEPAFSYCAARGCNYELAENSNFYEGQYNFFGCYEFADDHVNTVYYPWADASKRIYRWQLAEMNLTLVNGDTPIRCLQFTNDASDSYGDRTVEIPVERTSSNSYDADSGWYATRETTAAIGGSAGPAAFHAFFDAQDQFMGIVIEAADPDDEGSMFISGLEFVYKEGCDRVAKVTNPAGDRTYSFTNKTGEWSGSGTIVGSSYNRGWERTPWGGIVEDDERLLSGTAPPRPYIPETSNGATPDEAYSAALYTWSTQQLRQLFAKVFEVRAVPDIDVGSSGGAGSCMSGANFGQSCTTNDDCRYPIPASSAVSCLSQTVQACRGGMLPFATGDGVTACTASSCTNGRVCLNTTTGAACAGGGAGCACRRSAAGRPCTGAASCGTGGACESQVCVVGEGASAAAQASNDDGCRNDADCAGVAGACQTQTENLCAAVNGVPPGIHCTPATVESDCRSSLLIPSTCSLYTPVPTAGITSVPIGFSYGSLRTTESWDIRPEMGQPPLVFAVGSCDPSNGMCEEGGAGLNDTITVSGQSGGDVVGIGGLMSADMKFFYRADEDQMPIRRMRVEWGDGLASYDPGDPETNSFPNRRGMTDNAAAGVWATSACGGTTFGTVEDVACIDRPFSMTHVYTCGGPGALPDCTDAGGTRPGSGQEATGCYDDSFTSPSGRDGACVYIPRVHIKDNWGFCNGRCPNQTSGAGAYGTRADGEKCFDGTGLTTPASNPLNTNECGPTSTVPPDTAWTSFQGRVIVGPP